MYIVVTGAAGFIGSNLVRSLNARGHDNILAVDNLGTGDKFRNLVDCDIADYLDKEEFLARLADGDLDDDIEAILHQGACSDTLETDARYMLRNNHRYSVTLLEHCQDNDVPLLYASSASVYGAGTVFREERAHEAPLNVYGYSKFLFDQYAEHGAVRLFEGSGGYAAGEQRRDFVSVDDVVKVNLHFLGGRDRSGIYNLGTGRATSFNEVAAAVVNACRAREGQPARTVAELVAAGAIVYVPFPADLAGKYQSFTQADLARLRAAGYTAPMLAIEEGVRHYAEGLITPAP